MPSISYMITGYINKFNEILASRRGLALAILIASLAAITAFGLYIRLLPALKWGLEFHGNDPWIAYWETKYVYEHGPLSWWSLTRDNPATKIFWYPLGRDFSRTDYPGIALWTALTYHIVRFTGITLKEWLIIQPLIFTVFAIIAVYLAMKEIMDSKLAGILGALFYAVIPAASDRTIIGFVEKEGIAAPFIFLFIYFYSKMVKEVARGRKLLYSILAGVMAGLVGWFWGGFAFVYASVPLTLLLYPIMLRHRLTLETIKYNFIISLVSLAVASPSLTCLKILGIYPFKIGVGIIALALYALPTLYYLLGVKKRIMTPGKYFGLLVLLIIVGALMVHYGVVRLAGRYIYALGLKFLIPTSPLVESIEEHQPALAAHGLIGVMATWGWTGIILALLGALYLLYKSREDTVYAAIAFIISFYAYMNATYFEALASTYGVVTASAFISYLLLKALPQRIIVKRKRGRVITHVRRGSALALLLALIFLIPVAATTPDLIETHQHLVPTIMASGAPLSDRNPAWYEALDFIKKNMSKDALIITWWDYGYWISVITGRRTVADGATLNETQIRILARFFTSFNESEALSYLKKFNPPINDTYVLVFDVFRFIERDNKIYVMPAYTRIAGLIDIPKSRWMISIGRRDKDPGFGKYFYVYLHRATGLFIISPRFDKPEDLPIIYKIMVNGILYLSKIENKTYIFRWYTGTETALDPTLRDRIRDMIGMDLTTEIDLPNVQALLYKDLTYKDDYSKVDMKYIKPYKIIYAPFERHKGFYVVIFIFKVYFP